MTKNSAPSGATAKPCLDVPFSKENLDEMIDHLLSVEGYLVAEEENAVKAFDGSAERGHPVDRFTIDHLADTTRTLHGLRDVLTSIDVQIGVASLTGGRRRFEIDMWLLGESTGYGAGTIAELYENLSDDDEDASQGIDLVGFVHDLIRDREKLLERIEAVDTETVAGLTLEIDRMRRKRELLARKAAFDAGLIAEEDLPSEEDAAHVMAAAGVGNWSNVSDRQFKNLHIGTAYTMTPDDEALIREIQTETAYAAASAQRDEDEVDDEDCDVLEWAPGKCNGTPASGPGSDRRSVIIRRGDEEIEVR
ncbi:hypothetical protein [Devosia sp. MC521]|uniref:hypothetical protein n=1 Tax=Devosia sp. MC521 TaxID=2759954 RepID=UPI0015F8EB59|nr:hypothetical protein [Devosia sp. MC521]MBJ6986049.1 hypothetical protein [Devosia sp. MC521]QMW61419.1 hypothetical protein H4N61_10535 [Devosia sp. MC521]